MAAFDAQRAALALMGDMDPAAFDSAVRERCARHFVAAFANGRAAELFGLARLDEVLRSDATPLTQIDLYQDGHLIRLAEVQKKSGRSGLTVVAERVGQGATVRVRDIEALDPRLGLFAAAVRSQFASPAQINVYLTPPRQDGFPPHFDITDGFVVQCLGAKQWRVYTDYTERLELPYTSTNWEPERFRPLGVPKELLLDSGDVLYLPRGVMHEARCTDRASLHLTVSIEPLTYMELLRRTLERVTVADVAWRRRVPWSMAGGAEEDRRVAADLRKHLLTLVDALDVPALLAHERAALGGVAVPGTATVPAEATLADSLGDLFQSPRQGGPA